MLLEQLAVGVVVDGGAGVAEGFHLPGVVAPPDAEHHPALGQVVGHGEVFSQPQWVPHGIDVEAATEFEVLGQVGQMDEEQQQVGDTLVSFPLKMVFSGPERVVAQPFHRQNDGFGFVEYRR